ncbi:MAG: Bug family tripartite tricarboxylate transporter substrate binding protein [Comamonas sp.]
MAAAAAAGLPMMAEAQGAYPNKPVRLVISQAAGGSSDTIARLWAEIAARQLGGSVVVDNKPGAGGIIAAQAVLSQPADGYTLFFAGVSQMVLNQFVYKPLPYSPLTDFAGVGMLTTVPFVLVASPKSGIKSFADLVARAKQQPGALNFSSAGLGNSTHLAVELLQKRAGIQMTHVPYKGETDGLIALAGGDVQLMAPVLGTALPQIKAGKVVPLALLAPQRMPDLPDVPTARELGLQGFDSLGWSGIAAKAGTPPEIIAKLHATIAAFHRDPRVQERLKTMATIAMQGPAEQLMETARRDSATWAEAISELNLSAK